MRSFTTPPPMRVVLCLVAQPCLTLCQKGILTFATTWMNLENITPGEKCQPQKTNTV